MKKYKYSWLECIKSYRFHSIFFKNLILIFSMTIVPFLCVLGITYYSYDQIHKSEEKAYIDEMRTMIYKDVDNLLDILEFCDLEYNICDLKPILR